MPYNNNIFNRLQMLLLLKLKHGNCDFEKYKKLAQKIC